MGSPARPSNQPRRPRKAQEDSRTKFDKWLIEKKEKGETVSFLFQFHPIFASSDLGDVESSYLVMAKICEVDRYNVLLEFHDSDEDATWIRWVAKMNIISVG